MPTELHSEMMIRDVHIADRPRERLIAQGADSLSNQELIAILLRTGTKEESVLVLANRMLSFFDKIQDLRDATIEELMSVKGIGKAKAVQVLASVEIGKRKAVVPKELPGEVYNQIPGGRSSLFDDRYDRVEPRAFRGSFFKCQK